MEILGVNIWVWVTGIAFAVIFGWYCWKMAMQGDDWSDPKKSWSPSVDQKKGETVRNHSPGAMNR